MAKESKSGCTISGSLYVIFSLCTALIGYEIHGSVFWAIMDFIFTVFAWIKWIIFHEVTLTIIKRAFDWFLK